MTIVGLIVGAKDWDTSGVLVALDCLEEVVDEAIDKDISLIVTHHPIVFSGLKRFNGATYIERVVMKAIKNDIAIYAIHTNLDNVHWGVNAKIIQMLGLVKHSVLSPMKNSLKISSLCSKFSCRIYRVSSFLCWWRQG